MEIKLKVTDDEDRLINMEHALRCAKRFHKEYPERVGFSSGVVYSYPELKIAFYVYRTPKGTVVSRSC
jgi:hypothetical protein